MHESQPPIKTVLDVAIQAVSALAEAYQARIIHRDINPDNIMIRTNGLVKVLDFGLAKKIAGTSKIFSISQPI